MARHTVLSLLGPKLKRQLGRRSDREVAQQFGLSRSSVAAYRDSLGIAPGGVSGRPKGKRGKSHVVSVAKPAEYGMIGP